MSFEIQYYYGLLKIQKRIMERKKEIGNGRFEIMSQALLQRKSIILERQIEVCRRSAGDEGIGRTRRVIGPLDVLSIYWFFHYWRENIGFSSFSSSSSYICRKLSSKIEAIFLGYFIFPCFYQNFAPSYYQYHVSRYPSDVNF